MCSADLKAKRGSKVKRLSQVATAVFVLAAEAALAGGISYEVRVLEFSRGKRDKAMFVLESDTEALMPDCRRIQIATDYAVWNLPWAKPLVTRGTHRLALTRLKAAFESGKVTRFGMLGEGLGREPEDQCHFRSHGLAILVEQAGTDAVYSVYKQP